MDKEQKVHDLIAYVVPNKKLVADDTKKVILIADLHDYTKDTDKSDKLAEEIKKQNPHHVVIAGDNIQGAKWESQRAVGDFARFVDNVSEAAPVFISQGNHDLVGITDDNREVRIGNFKRLENIRPGSIYSLVNDKVFIDGFEIIGYTPSSDIIGGLGIQEHGQAHDRFIEEYEKNGVKPDGKDDTIVEFVGHNPHIIAQSENGVGLEDLAKVDTFYAGHLHNGYRRSSTTGENPEKYLDNGYVEKPFTQDKDGKLIKSSLNLLFFGKTNLCRGVVYINDESQQRFLQLNDNSFYINQATDVNKQIWVPVTNEIAKKHIIENNLHALVITGGIRKFFGFDVPGDLPEITEVIYHGKRK